MQSMSDVARCRMSGVIDNALSPIHHPVSKSGNPLTKVWKKISMTKFTVESIAPPAYNNVYRHTNLFPSPESRGVLKKDDIRIVCFQKSRGKKKDDTVGSAPPCVARTCFQIRKAERGKKMTQWGPTVRPAPMRITDTPDPVSKSGKPRGKKNDTQVSPGVISQMNPGPYWPLYLWGWHVHVGGDNEPPSAKGEF